MAKWPVTYHKLAKPELLRIQQASPRVFEAICNTMALLAKECDPRCPLHPGLSVCPMREDAPGWFRVKVIGAGNWRVVFRLLQRVDGRIEEIDVRGVIEDTEHTIQITRAAARSDVYGYPLRKRTREVRTR